MGFRLYLLFEIFDGEKCKVVLLPVYEIKYRYVVNVKHSRCDSICYLR